MSVLTTQERPADAKPKALRRQGMVPMALQEKEGKSRLLMASEKDVKLALAHATGAGLLDLVFDGESKKHSVVLKKVDRDILTRHIVHVSFMEVSKDDLIKVDLPVVAMGTPQAVADDEGTLMHPADHISVRGKMASIPDHIEVDVSGLEIGSSITASEVKLPKGLELMSSPDSVLFVIQSAASLEREEEAALATEDAETPAEETEGETA